MKAKSCCILKLLEQTEIWGPRAHGPQGREVQVNLNLPGQKHLETGVPQALGKNEVTFRPYVTVG